MYSLIVYYFVNIFAGYQSGETTPVVLLNKVIIKYFSELIFVETFCVDKILFTYTYIDII